MLHKILVASYRPLECLLRIRSYRLREPNKGTWAIQIPDRKCKRKPKPKPKPKPKLVGAIKNYLAGASKPY